MVKGNSSHSLYTSYCSAWIANGDDSEMTFYRDEGWFLFTLLYHNSQTIFELFSSFSKQKPDIKTRRLKTREYFEGAWI